MKKLLLNVQILSALIWVSVIIGCSYATGNNDIAAILITAVGFHVVMMSRFNKEKTSC